MSVLIWIKVRVILCPGDLSLLKVPPLPRVRHQFMSSCGLKSCKITQDSRHISAIDHRKCVFIWDVYCERRRRWLLCLKEYGIRESCHVWPVFHIYLSNQRSILRLRAQSTGLHAKTAPITFSYPHPGNISTEIDLVCSTSFCILCGIIYLYFEVLLPVSFRHFLLTYQSLSP